MVIEQSFANRGIPLPFRRRARRIDERVGHTAHGGRDDGDPMTLGDLFGDEARGLRDTFGGTDRGPSEFHDYEHWTGEVKGQKAKVKSKGKGLGAGKGMGLGVSPGTRSARERRAFALGAARPQ